MSCTVHNNQIQDEPQLPAKNPEEGEASRRGTVRLPKAEIRKLRGLINDMKDRYKFAKFTYHDDPHKDQELRDRFHDGTLTFWEARLIITRCSAQIINERGHDRASRDQIRSELVERYPIWSRPEPWRLSDGALRKVGLRPGQAKPYANRERPDIAALPSSAPAIPYLIASENEAPLGVALWENMRAVDGKASQEGLVAALARFGDAGARAFASSLGDKGLHLKTVRMRKNGRIVYAVDREHDPDRARSGPLWHSVVRVVRPGSFTREAGAEAVQSEEQ